MAGRAKPFAALPGQSAGEDLLRGFGSSLRGQEPAPGISLRALPKAIGTLAIRSVVLGSQLSETAQPATLAVESARFSQAKEYPGYVKRVGSAKPMSILVT